MLMAQRSWPRPRNRFALAVRAAAGEIVESLVGHPDEVAVDERCAFRRALLGMLEAAFPFEHRPAGIVVARKLREDAGEVDLSVAERAETARPA